MGLLTQARCGITVPGALENSQLITPANQIHETPPIKLRVVVVFVFASLLPCITCGWMMYVGAGVAVIHGLVGLWCHW